jgi:hypothetical protein
MSAEEWRPSMVPNYEVSSLGRVRRSAPGRKTYAGRVMAPVVLKIGYVAVSPTVDGRNRTFYIHELVADAFIGPRPSGASVNHIDGVKTNNVPANLEYVTHAENMRHAANAELMVRGEDHPQHKLTEDGVRQLRVDRAGGMSFSKLAAKHGISIATAFNVVNRKYWSHVA